MREICAKHGLKPMIWSDMFFRLGSKNNDYYDMQWDIPPDVKPDLPLEELQQAMAKGLPENWASREVMRMREE